MEEKICNAYWSGKKMNALGDSLTYGDISGVGTDGIPWTNYIPALTGLSVCRNYGINGNTVAGPGGMAERYAGMDPDADIVSVYGGMNDFCFSVPIGKSGDTGVDTFCGALDTLARGLYKKYPDAEIFFITPPKCKSSLYGWEAFTPNDGGFIMRDYRDAVLETADRYSFPVLDFYSCLGMSCYLDDGTYRPDGLHFTNAGYRRAARKIAAFINTL